MAAIRNDKAIEFIKANHLTMTPHEIAVQLGLGLATIYWHCNNIGVQCVRKMGRPTNPIDYELLAKEGITKTVKEWSRYFQVDENTIRNNMNRKGLAFKGATRKQKFTKQGLPNNDDCETLKPDMEHFQWLMPDLDVYFSRKVKTIEHEDAI